MPEENVAATEDPADSQGQPSPTEPAEPTAPAEPAQPSFVTISQVQEAINKALNDQKTWIGRRDKELLGYVGSTIEEKLKSTKPPEDPSELSSRLLENPKAVLSDLITNIEAERTQKQQSHLSDTMQNIGKMMESDPLYEDNDLGNEVVEEIKRMVQSNQFSYNQPPQFAAEATLGRALSNVMRQRKTAKVNPLSTNQPGNAPGGLPAPSSPAKPKTEHAQLDEYAQKLANRWGYSPEDLAKLFPK